MGHRTRMPMVCEPCQIIGERVLRGGLPRRSHGERSEAAADPEHGSDLSDGYVSFHTSLAKHTVTYEELSTHSCQSVSNQFRTEWKHNLSPPVVVYVYRIMLRPSLRESFTKNM